MRLPVLLGALFTGLALAAAPLHAAVSQPTASPLDAIADLAGARLWFNESEFALDHNLRATPEHVVILHLEPGAKGKRVRNAIPFVFPRTRSYRLCAPAGDPYIQSVRVEREDSHAVVVQVPRGAPCKERSIEAGLYQLVVEHDGSRIPAEGRKAFLHVPRSRGTLEAGAAGSTFATTCEERFTFRASSGLYVEALANDVLHVQSTPGIVLTSGWIICPDGAGNYVFSQPGIFNHPTTYITSAGPTGSDTRLYDTTGTPTKFKLQDLGAGQFTLMANFNGGLYPIVVQADGNLHWVPSGDPTVFTSVLKLYVNGLAVPPLQPEQIALYQACNYDPTGDTYVFTADVPDLGPFPMATAFQSMRVPVGTPSALYADTGFAGATQYVTADIPCFNGALWQSLRVIPTRAIVAATNECQNCNLSGVDLSDLDLSGGQFQGSTFTGANLSGSNFQFGNFNNANVAGASTGLSGTSFLGAQLRCTNFSGTNLSQATFQGGDAYPALVTDFSCRLDLTGTTLNLSSFAPRDWRYFNLTGATVNGVAGQTLSTTASPLDLSGAILNHAKLSGAKLDGANFGCATTAGGASVCTTMSDIDLHLSSLKKTNLINAQLQGARLDYANLDGANLCSARLNRSPDTAGSANLEGAFLRNVNLFQADLTGASLRHANLYSSVAKATCQTSACSATLSCASVQGAVMHGVDFSGAYLSGTDFTGASPQSAIFSQAYLVGANLTNANLSEDVNGSRVNFSGARLQGANFSNANAKDASFLSSYVNLAGGAQQLMFLDADNLLFAGYQVNANSGCVQFTYAHATVVPPTDATNICPDDNLGACTSAQWTAPFTPMPGVPASCTAASVDFSW